MEETPERVSQELLLSQYRASLSQGNKLAVRMEQTSLAGFLLLAALTAFLFLFRASLPLAIAWTAPLAYLAVFGSLIGLAAQQVAAAWQTRIFSAQLTPPDAGAEAVPAPAAPPRDPLNLWRLSWKLRLLAGVPAAVFAGLFLLVSIYCWRPIYAYSHIMGLAFALFYLALALVEVAALSGVYADLPRQYRTAYLAAAAGQPLPADLASLSPAWTLQTVGRWIAPFPGQALGRGRIFWAGWLAPALITGLSASRLEILNTLFRRDLDWETTGAAPFLAIVALGLVFYLIFEILLQQAVLIWTALRAGQAGGVPYPVPQAIGRWLAALLLAYLVDPRGLFVLVVVFSAYELILTLLVRQPLASLLLGAINLPLRFAAGVLVWGGPSWDFAIYLGLAVMAYFLALGLDAAAGRQEARTLAEEDRRPRNAYFLKSGGYWRNVGLWAALLCGLTLLVVQALAENCAFRVTSPLVGVYAHCPPGAFTLIYTQVDRLNGLLIGFDLLVFVLLLSMLLVWLLGPRLARLNAAARPINPMAVQSYFLLALVILLIAFLRGSPAWAIGGAELALVGLIASKEEQT